MQTFSFYSTLVKIVIDSPEREGGQLKHIFISNALNTNEWKKKNDNFSVFYIVHDGYCRFSVYILFGVQIKELSLCHKLPISLQHSVLDLRYLKQCILFNHLCLQYYRFIPSGGKHIGNKNLCQKRNSLKHFQFLNTFRRRF